MGSSSFLLLSFQTILYIFYYYFSIKTRMWWGMGTGLNTELLQLYEQRFYGHVQDFMDRPEDFTEGSRSQTLCTSQTETSTGVASSYLACIITFVEAFYANVGCNLPYLTLSPGECHSPSELTRNWRKQSSTNETHRAENYQITLFLISENGERS